MTHKDTKYHHGHCNHKGTVFQKLKSKRDPKATPKNKLKKKKKKKKKKVGPPRPNNIQITMRGSWREEDRLSIISAPLTLSHDRLMRTKMKNSKRILGKKKEIPKDQKQGMIIQKGKERQSIT